MSSHIKRWITPTSRGFLIQNSVSLKSRQKGLLEGFFFSFKFVRIAFVWKYRKSERPSAYLSVFLFGVFQNTVSAFCITLRCHISASKMSDLWLILYYKMWFKLRKHRPGSSSSLPEDELREQLVLQKERRERLLRFMSIRDSRRCFRYESRLSKI